jgi:hypothetical protein
MAGRLDAPATAGWSLVLANALESVFEPDLATSDDTRIRLLTSGFDAPPVPNVS